MHTTPPTTHRTSFFSLIFLIGLLAFGCALGMKWMKWPGGSGMLIISGALTLIGAFTQAGRDADRSLVVIMRLAMASLVIYAVWRLLYFPGALVFALAATLLSVSALLLWWRSAQVRTGAFAALLLFVVGGAALMVTPVYALYGYMMLETPGAQRFIHSGVGQWYRYSWLLYQDGQYAKSAVMIDSAKAIVSDYDARTGISGEWIQVKLDSTRARIQTREWESFHELAQ